MIEVALEGNPEGCVGPQRRGERSCVECHWSQVNERKQWTGSERCLDAQCVVAREDK